MASCEENRLELIDDILRTNIVACITCISDRANKGTHGATVHAHFSVCGKQRLRDVPHRASLKIISVSNCS